MKRILPIIFILMAILFIAYKILYSNSEEERIKIEKAQREEREIEERQLEDRQIEKMMGINFQEDKRVKIPTH
jgi:preprotein translocase subunit SecY